MQWMISCFIKTTANTTILIWYVLILNSLICTTKWGADQTNKSMHTPSGQNIDFSSVQKSKHDSKLYSKRPIGGLTAALTPHIHSTKQRIPEVQNGCHWKISLEIVCSKPSAEAGPPNACCTIQAGFEYLHRRNLYNPGNLFEYSVTLKVKTPFSY